MSSSLRRQGYSTREAASGAQALDALRAARPDLILLDMFLTGGSDDGWAFLGKLRANPEWQSVPVLIITGLGIACDEWAKSLGAQAVARKPIDPDELLPRIQKCLNGKA